MDHDAFLEVFNTLYAVDMSGNNAEEFPLDRKATDKDKKGEKQAGAEGGGVAGSREGRCEGSWGGEGCGGR